MRKWSRPFLIGVLMLVLWTSACNVPVQTPVPPSTTIIPTEQIASLIPTGTGVTSVTETGTPAAPVIPITGENVVEMQCQFCVNSFAHAVFIFPDSAIFDVESGSPITCLTAEVINGKRVLVCNGAQSTSFNLKICSDASNCLLFPVALQPCPLTTGTGTPVTTVTPVFLTAINTLLPASRTPRPRAPVASQAATETGTPATPAPSTIPSSPVPTSVTEPPPADTSTSAPPPPPPTQPADTPAPTSAPTDGHRRPTHTPRL